MAWHGLVLISVWCSVALVLMGCAPTASSGGNASADAFYAFSRAVVVGKATLPNVLNRLNGDIIIDTGRPDEVAVDAVVTGMGKTREAARILASTRVVLTNNADRVEIRRLDDSDAALLARAWLHLRVPPEIDLPAIGVGTGNIEVDGGVGKVTATITDAGDIRVRGANGDVALTTQKGSIIADVMPTRSIIAHAKEGNLDLCTVGANVDASTTNGWVRFIGTLRGGQTHNLVTTGAGSIQIAVPAYPKDHPAGQVYRVTASTAGNSINIEFPAYRFKGDGQLQNALPICGFIYSSGPYDYHVENTSASTGRIEVTPVVTGTYFYTGTLDDAFYRFDTNQTQIAFYSPVSQSIHIYTSAQLNRIKAGQEKIVPDCEAALNDPALGAVVLNLKTDRGPITIQHIRMLGDGAP
jgi:hypothetical protein